MAIKNNVTDRDVTNHDATLAINTVRPGDPTRRAVPAIAAAVVCSSDTISRVGSAIKTVAAACLTTSAAAIDSSSTLVSAALQCALSVVPLAGALCVVNIIDDDADHQLKNKGTQREALKAIVGCFMASIYGVLPSTGIEIVVYGANPQVALPAALLKGACAYGLNRLVKRLFTCFG